MDMKSPTPEAAESAPANDALNAALQSEFAYFRAGAVVRTGVDWFVTQMLGLEHIPSASYGFWDPACDNTAAARVAVTDIQTAFDQLGACQTRFYSKAISPLVAEFLGERGFLYREEVVFLQPSHQPKQAGAVLEMCAVTSEADWQDKLALHQTSHELSDGHQASPEEWVALERRKAETGDLTLYLFKLDGEIVATAGLMRPVKGTVRLKNLFVGGHHRGKRLGRAMLEALAERAHRTHSCRPVIYAVKGSVGERLYASSGFQAVGSVYEWIKPAR